MFPIVAVQTCLFAKPLLSNGYRVFVYLAVVAQQRVYMPQYAGWLGLSHNSGGGGTWVWCNSGMMIRTETPKVGL
jgi:hypothetical protein